MPLPGLITRPEPGASATVGRVQALASRPVRAPLLAVSALQPVFPPAASVQAVVIASRQALAGVPPVFFGVPLFAVGDASAAAARAHGFRRVESAAGDARSLARLVGERLDPA